MLRVSQRQSVNPSAVAIIASRPSATLDGSGKPCYYDVVVSLNNGGEVVEAVEWRSEPRDFKNAKKRVGVLTREWENLMRPEPKK
jgi:hypothetical protein